jgi:ATP/maltotriose-dependent transcriptional regulator MalT
MILLSRCLTPPSIADGASSARHNLKLAQLDNLVDATLSARECDILGLISQGFSNKSIARMLGISPETVKTHLKRIFLKLAVGTRAAAVTRATSLGSLNVQPQREALNWPQKSRERV